MVVGVCTIELRIAGARSLKEKRRVLKSLVTKIKNKFNVSISQVENLNSWQLATLGVACVSNSTGHVHQILDNMLDYIEAFAGAEIIHVDREIL